VSILREGSYITKAYLITRGGAYNIYRGAYCLLYTSYKANNYKFYIINCLGASKQELGYTLY
jgi:hypothetical protein